MGRGEVSFLKKEGCFVFEPGKEGFKDWQDWVERKCVRIGNVGDV